MSQCGFKFELFVVDAVVVFRSLKVRIVVVDVDAQNVLYRRCSELLLTGKSKRNRIEQSVSAEFVLKPRESSKIVRRTLHNFRLSLSISMGDSVSFRSWIIVKCDWKRAKINDTGCNSR